MIAPLIEQLSAYSWDSRKEAADLLTTLYRNQALDKAARAEILATRSRITAAHQDYHGDDSHCDPHSDYHTDEGSGSAAWRVGQPDAFATGLSFDDCCDPGQMLGNMLCGIANDDMLGRRPVTFTWLLRQIVTIVSFRRRVPYGGVAPGGKIPLSAPRRSGG